VAPNPPRATDDDGDAEGALATLDEDDGAEEALLPNPPRITVVLTGSTV
jgi:hypothetical protein